MRVGGVARRVRGGVENADVDAEPRSDTVVNAGGSDVIRPRVRANYPSGREPQEEGEGKERLYGGMCQMKCVYVRVICSLHNYKIFLPWPNTYYKKSEFTP